MAGLEIGMGAITRDPRLAGFLFFAGCVPLWAAGGCPDCVLLSVDCAASCGFGSSLLRVPSCCGAARAGNATFSRKYSAPKSMQLLILTLGSPAVRASWQGSVILGHRIQRYPELTLVLLTGGRGRKSM